MRHHVYLVPVERRGRPAVTGSPAAGAGFAAAHHVGAAGRRIVKNWNYTEFFPLNWAAVADYQAAHHALYGRYPSFARLMKNARIKDQFLVFEELNSRPSRVTEYPQKPT
ncbi:MAG TPA: hypothetical protein VFV73_42985 [Streptosporangiaceae bacterium]|nr:hypothetical protein [Streptosporangiaceae bacterium]HEX5301680.1 hypothetical protein [Streptosporangiaceae bacterium]